jgi:hypothetical protein
MPFFFHRHEVGKTIGDTGDGSLLVALALAASLSFAGCGKKQTSVTPAAPAESNANPPSASSEMPAPAPVVVSANPAGGVDLKELNHAYVAWIVQHRQAPKSFEEFIKLSGMQVPPPPPGKKYVIDHAGFINFENQ